MRLLPAKRWKRALVVAINVAIVLIVPFEWRFVCITLGFPHESADGACEFVKFLLVDLNWVFGLVVGSGLMTAILVGRGGLTGRRRRKAQLCLAVALALFGINHLALIEVGNGADLLLRIGSGVAHLSVATPPEAPTWIMPYGRVFFEQPVQGLKISFDPGITGQLFCDSRSFVYVQSTFVTIWPLSALAIGGSAGPLFWRRRNGSGYCSECGYDLTGNVSSICPECGQRIKNTVLAGPNGRFGCESVKAV